MMRDLELEKALIGALALDPSQLDGIRVQPDDLQDARHGEILKTMLAMRDRGELIDSITLNANLPKGFDLGLIYELMDYAPTGSAAGFYANQVINSATNRRLNILAETMTAGRLSPDEVSERLSEIISRKKQTQKQIEFDAHDLWLEQADFINSKPNYTTTGLDLLDEVIDGWRPGALYIIAARPGVGKTLLGLQLALAAAKHGQATFFSIEMSRQELMNRIVAQKASIPLSRIMRHELTDDDWNKYAKARQEAFDLKIIDEGQMTISSMKRYLTENPQVKYVFVDYLGIMQGEGGSQYEKITQISNGLKQVARQFDVPIIALHQLNRSIESRSTNTPVLADLRDSGAIEQDGDVVMLLARDELPLSHYPGLPAEARKNKLMRIIIAKNRHGKTEAIEFKVSGSYQRLERL